MWKCEYEIVKTHLVAGERDFPSHPDLSFTTALSHILVNSHSHRKGGVQKAASMDAFSFPALS